MPVWNQVFDEEITDFDDRAPSGAFEGDVSRLSDFDSLQDPNSDITQNGTQVHDGSYSIKVEYNDDTACYGVINADAVNNTSGFVSFWIKIEPLEARDGLVVLIRMLDGAGGNNWDMYLLANNTIVCRYKADGGAMTTIGISGDLSTGWHKLELHFTASTGAGNDDGENYFRVDDVLIGSAVGVDNDTRDWDYARIGKVVNFSTTFGGFFFLDTIYVDPDGTAYVDKLSAYSGTYGLTIPVIDNTNRSVTFDDPAGETEITIECMLNPSLLDLAEDDELRFVNSGGEFWLIVGYDGADYYINGVIKDDLAEVTTSANHVITADWHRIRALWIQSSGADDGYLKIYIDKSLVETLSGIDNDTTVVIDIDYGARYWEVFTSSSGLLYMDDCKWASALYDPSGFMMIGSNF